MSSCTIGNGAAMPMVGLGCWKGITEEIVYLALKAGYRHIDGACDYGNEEAVGRGLKRAFDEGICTRADVFVTTKLWNTYHRREHVEPACRRSLSDMGLDYVDLYLIHFPISLKFVPFETRYPPEWVHDPNGDETTKAMVIDPVPYRETWEAMEALVGKGLARNIGVCNLSCSLMADVLSYATIKPAMNQVENHPFLTQMKLVEFCKKHGIAVTAFSPLGGSGYVEINMASPDELLVDHSVVKGIAEATGKTPGQVLIRFQVQRGLIVIPKTKTPSRLTENLDVFGFELTEEQMGALFALNKNKRYNDPGEFVKGMGGWPHGYPIYD